MACRDGFGLHAGRRPKLRSASFDQAARDRLYVLLPILAWLGNALYAIGPRGGFLETLAPMIVAAALLTFVVLHGVERYGPGLLLRFVLCVFLIGWFFETFSVMTGFPFGQYHYSEIMAPFLGHVPVFVLPAYLFMGYASWSLACLFLGQFQIAITGARVVAVPALAAFFMVIWDLSMDPLRATLEGRWLWLSGGFYYDIPVSNFLGWFGVTSTMFLGFSLQLRNGTRLPARNAPMSRNFWLGVPLAYGSFAGEYLLNPFTGKANELSIVISDQAMSVQQFYTEIALVCGVTILPIACAGLAIVWLRPPKSQRPVSPYDPQTAPVLRK